MLNNGFGSNWDAYVKNLFTILLAKNIAAVGITDYFTVDGYKKLTEEYVSNDVKLATLFSSHDIERIRRILVLPNIEFRSDIFVGPNSVNFHVIFSEAVPVKDIEEKFLHEIDFLYQGEPQSEDKKRKLIDAEKSDLFDVLAYVAYALPPLTRDERAGRAKVAIGRHFNSKQQAFLGFVLAHYVGVGVDELDQEKLTPLLRLKYRNSIADAIADLGRPEEISRVFARFQKYLYQPVA